MFDRIPELSPDLEWVLQSGQASDEMVVTAMVDECFEPLYRLAYALLNDQPSAQRAAIIALATALIEAHRYPGGDSVQTWLTSIALEVCSDLAKDHSDRFNRQLPRLPLTGSFAKIRPQSTGEAALWEAVDSLPRELREALILQAVHGLTTLEIAASIKIDRETAAGRLESAYQRLHEWHERAAAVENSQGRESIPGLVATSLQTRWPLGTLSQAERDRLVRSILHFAREKRQAWRRFVHLRETALVGLVIVLVIAAVASADALFAKSKFEPPPAPLITATARASQNPAPLPKSAISVRPVPEPGALAQAVEPLTVQSSAEAIWQRMQRRPPHWRTLWADVLIHYYGPEGYIGPPATERHQVWISRGESGLVSSGTLEGGPEQLSLITPNPGWDFRSIPHLSILEAAGSQYPWFILSSLGPAGSSFQIVRPFQIAYNRAQQQASLHVTRSGTVAGREALIVEQRDPQGLREARLWVDALSGILMREQHFGEFDRELIVREVIVTSLALDVDFPESIFDPGQNSFLKAGYVADHNAMVLSPQDESLYAGLGTVPARQRLPMLPATPEFDPSRSRLTFQSNKENLPGDSMHDILELFAGKFYLGKTWIGDPFSLLCTRSPDGNLIAIAGRSTARNSNVHHLRWIDLADPQDSHTIAAMQNVHGLAFSPDGRRLAVSDIGAPYPADPSPNPGIFIYDLEDGNFGLIYRSDTVQLLGWSPDGEYVAGVEWAEKTPSGFEAFAIHVETKEMTGGQVILADNDTYSVAFPELEWQADFNLMPAGLEGCLNPPER